MKKKVIGLSESQLVGIVNKIVKEQLEEKDFLKGLVVDLYNHSDKIEDFKLVDDTNDRDDVIDRAESRYGSFNVEYIFEFNYNGKPYSLMVSGEVDYSVSPEDSGDWFTPPSGGEVSIDRKTLGNGLKLELLDVDENEYVDLSIVPDEIKKKIAKNIMIDYL